MWLLLYDCVLCQLEVLRTWPRDSSEAHGVAANGIAPSSSSASSVASPSSPPSDCVRLTLIDVNRAEANQPIDLVARGAWQATLCGVEKYDVLIISGCRVERVEVEQAASSAVVNTADPMECDYRILLDDSTDQAALIVYGWRDRILQRPGRPYTAQQIKGQQSQ